MYTIIIIIIAFKVVYHSVAHQVHLKIKNFV